MSNIIEARFCYKLDYQKRGGSRWRSAFLNATQIVAIDDVPAQTAPVAYRLTSDYHRTSTTLDVRLYGGSLWWPLDGLNGRLKAAEFIAWAQNDWEKAAGVLDPMNWTYYVGRCETFDEFRDAVPIRETFRSDINEQARLVRELSARLIFIDGEVYVEAGEPVWFAVFQKDSRWSFELVAGPAAFDRQDREGYWMPSPDRGTRLTCARLGRAFGVGELEDRLTWLGADHIDKTWDVVPTGIHSAEPSATVCAKAWAQYLWECAWRSQDLRHAIPALAEAAWRKPLPASFPYKEMLHQFVALEGTDAEKGLPCPISEAVLLIERLQRAGDTDDDWDIPMFGT